MARKRKKKESLVYQVQKTLEAKLAIGDSKANDKSMETLRLREKKKYNPKATLSYEERITIHKIYSWKTFHDYQHNCCAFVKWCKDNYNCRTLEECRPYANEWLASYSNYSAYTQKAYACAIAKLYSCTLMDLAPTPIRHRADITRSRTAAQRDKNFNAENHKEFIEFCKGTGLRKSELECLRGDQLLYRNGQYYIAVTRGAKGGRYREAPIISNVEDIVARIKNAGDNKVWDYVPDLDVHSLRSEYCCEIYKKHAHPLEDIPKKERYICRGDLKGVIYDKKAMLIASQCLGHNRISVIAGHYLR